MSGVKSLAWTSTCNTETQLQKLQCNTGATAHACKMRDCRAVTKFFHTAFLSLCKSAKVSLPFVQGAPVYDYPSSTLTLNITVISDPSALKFQDGIAKQTYQNALQPNQFAKVIARLWALQNNPFYVLTFVRNSSH